MNDEPFVTPGLEPEAELPSDNPMAEPGPVRPPAIFTGNWYDLVAVGALVSSVLTAFVCFTLSYGIYLLPFLSLALGIIGVLTAQRALNQERARLWSWVGLGIGIALVALLVLCVVFYFGLFVLMMGMPFLFAGAD